jgi:DNA-directed RNA polymerase
MQDLPVEDQAQLEAEMQRRGQTRTEKRYRDSLAKGRETGTKAGARLLRDLGGAMTLAIDEWRKAAKSSPGRRHRALEHLEKFSSKKLAVFTLKVVLDCLTRERAFTATAMQIGARCEDEERYTAFKEQGAMHFDRALRRSNDYSSYNERRRHILKAMALFGIAHPRWPKEERCSVGTVLLQLCIDKCGVCYAYHARKVGRKHPELRLGATQEVLEWVEDVNIRGSLMAPMQLPFVEAPLDWKDPVSGGFHSTDIHSTAIVKTQNRSIVEKLYGANMPLVYRATNHLQNTRWGINPMIFEMFDHYWQMDVAVPGLPRRDTNPIPAKPADIDTNEEARKEWRKAARGCHDTNNRRMQDRLTTAKIHWVCENYKDLEAFYFCHQLDWRGRAYPVSYFLHPQGNDLVKSLLQFADGKRLDNMEAINWHSIHGANCWGLDKKNFDERIKWVCSHHAEIMAVGEDPLANRMWMEADEPWQFLAWCDDYFQFQNDPLHESKIVVHQDATQSGIQIYSLLLRDREGARSTNVIPSPEPQDLYRQVAEKTLELLREDPAPVSKDWLAFGIDRACCKRPVMTRVYNATKHSARVYIGDWAGEQDRPIPVMGGENKSATWFLTSKVWEATNFVIASTSRGQEWLTEIAKVFAENNQAIEWVSPLGFPVRQWYPKWNSIVVKTSIGERFRQTSLLHEKDDADKRRMGSAFAPNFIHSLDAAAMMKTVALAADRGITHMAAIHDSFGTHAADSAVLAKVTREAYVALFSPDLLKSLLDQLQAQIPSVILPPCPEFGDLNVEELLNSPYFFS